jgi:hypothetical protein
MAADTKNRNFFNWPLLLYFKLRWAQILTVLLMPVPSEWMSHNNVCPMLISVLYECLSHVNICLVTHVGFFQLYVHDFYSTWNTYYSTWMGMLINMGQTLTWDRYQHGTDINMGQVRIIELFWLVNFGNIIQSEHSLHLLSEMIWFIHRLILLAPYFLFVQSEELLLLNPVIRVGENCRYV